MNTYDIWSEGYRVLRASGTARLIAQEVEAESFREACIAFSKTKRAQDFGHFDKEKLTFWGCQLFETYEEARQSFG